MSLPADTRFARVMPLVFEHEGGAAFTNDPQDPGGATRFGITLETLQGVRPGSTVDDVRHLSEADARAIYKARFWLAASCDKLPAGLDYMVMDCATNQGVGRAKRFLQQALGVVPDGDLGPKTLLALRGCDPGLTIRKFRTIREDHYRSLGGFPRYGRGWMRRVAEVESQALAWAGAEQAVGA